MATGEKLSDIVAAMHAAFNRVSGIEARPWAYDRFWFELARHGYTAEDVEAFCLWVKSENQWKSRPRQWHIPMMFSDIGYFDADLCLARAWHRNQRPAPTQREMALRDLRPIVDPELEKARRSPARSAGDVLRRILAPQA